MKKSLITVLTLATVFAISGCNSEQESKTPEKLKETAQQESEDTPITEKKSNKTSEEQLVSESKAEKKLNDKGNVVVSDWSNYFDQEFIDLVHSGKIKGVPYSLDTEVDKIKSELSNVAEDKYLGLPSFYYNDAIYTYRFDEDYISNIVYNVPNLNYDVMEKVMGEPVTRGWLTSPKVYQESYKIGSKTLYFESNEEDRESGISKIILTSWD